MTATPAPIANEGDADRNADTSTDPAAAPRPNLEPPPPRTHPEPPPLRPNSAASPRTHPEPPPPRPNPAPPPPTEQDQTAPRRVTTLELFFDLVFVFTITQLTVLLSTDLSFAQAARTLLIFAVLYWMYGAYAYLTNQVPPENLTRRVVLMLGMFGFLTCALAIPKVFSTDGLAFGLAYLLVTAVHSALYALIHRGYVLSFAVPNLAAAGCVTIAGATHGTATDLLWLAAVLLQQTAPVISSRVTADYGHGHGRAVVTEYVGELDPAHFVERHGLLLIIAFGESVVAIGAGAAGTRLDWALAAGIALALGLAATLWWAYFGHDESAAEHALARASGLRRSGWACVPITTASSRCSWASRSWPPV